MTHPLNVQACLDWYRQHMPDQVVFVEHLLTRAEKKPAPAMVLSDMRDWMSATAVVAVMLHGFEAGRAFQRQHPDVEAGSGYLTDGPLNVIFPGSIGRPKEP